MQHIAPASSRHTGNSAPSDMHIATRSLIGLAFFMSGFSALAYQITWQRVLSQCIGSDAISTILVVTIFMVNLGIGAELARRLLSRPGLSSGRIYAALELGIGLYGVCSIPLLRAVNAWWAGLGPSSPLADGIVNLAILAPPVAAMGMTSPLVVQIARQRIDQIGRTVGAFYALNILGAAVGSLVTGLILIEWLGLQGTTGIAAFANILIGLTLVQLLRRDGSEVSVGDLDTNPTNTLHSRFAPAAVLFGFGTLALQVGLFRVATNYFTMCSIVFPTLLTVYLVAMAGGQILGGWLADYFPANIPRTLASLAAIGIIVLVGVLRFPPAWAADMGALRFTTFNGQLVGASYRDLVGDPSLVTVLAFGAILLAPVMIWSALFPLMVRLGTARAEQVGRSFAGIYSLYTIGNVLGTVVFGLWVLPTLGTGGSLMVTSMLVGLAALVIAGKSSGWASGLAISGVVASVLVPLDIYKRLRLEDYRVRDVIEGVVGVATTVPTGNFYTIIDMNRTASASAMVRDPQPGDQYESWRWNLSELLAMDPSFRPRSALIIGIGHGYLIDALLDIPSLESVVVVDISPEVVEAVEAETITSTRRIFSDPRVSIVIGDGRRYIQNALAEGRHFDLIQTKINEPWHAGGGNLFTVEFMRMQRDLLSEGGYLGIRPLAGHVRDGLEVFGEALFGGFYHVYFRKGKLPPIESAIVSPDIKALWFRELPGSPARGSRPDSIDVWVFDDPDAFARIDANTDDRPTFEYYWLRQYLGKWESPRAALSAPAFDRFRRRIPVWVVEAAR